MCTYIMYLFIYLFINILIILNKTQGCTWSLYYLITTHRLFKQAQPLGQPLGPFEAPHASCRPISRTFGEPGVGLSFRRAEFWEHIMMDCFLGLRQVISAVFDQLRSLAMPQSSKDVDCSIPNSPNYFGHLQNSPKSSLAVGSPALCISSSVTEARDSWIHRPACIRGLWWPGHGSGEFQWLS